MTTEKVILFIDDFKPPKWYGLKTSQVVLFKTGNGAIDWLESNPDLTIDEMYLDHDLDDKVSGAYVLEYMVEHLLRRPEKVIIISLNAVGKQRMIKFCEYESIPYSIMLPPADLTIDGQSG